MTHSKAAVFLLLQLLPLLHQLLEIIADLLVKEDQLKQE